MRQETITSAYQTIQIAWLNNVSMNDIYLMIVNWIEVWKPETRVPTIAKLIEEYLQRCEAGEDMYDLVEEFIYSQRYAPIRNIFSESIK